MRWASNTFIALILLCQFGTIAYPVEAFPFSSMPMFSAYVGPETPRYRFRFYGEPTGAGPEIEIDARALGYDETRFMRQFFVNFYRSSDPAYPAGRYDTDSPDAFASRMQVLFPIMIEEYAKRHADAPPLTRVRLVVERVHPAPTTRAIGTYDHTERAFRFAPERQ